MPSRSLLFTLVLACCASGVLPAVDIHAQGSLATIGFGYPVGGLSTRAAGTAGAFADFDPLSPLNPAAIAGVQRLVLHAQTEPEYRALRMTDGERERVTVQRIPLLAAIFPLPGNFAVGMSTASFLDRSYSLLTSGSAVVDEQTVPTSDRLDIRGGIGDWRAAVAWQVSKRISLGVGGHLFMGEHLASRNRTFADTLSYGSVNDSSRVSYFGTALSIGGDVRLTSGLALSASYRAGQGIESRISDSLRTSASVPDRLGAALRYDGISGSIFSLAVERVNWSKMSTLGTGLSVAHDAMNVRAGAEVQGPQFRGFPILVRLGYAKNDLPFSVTADQVHETRFSAGIGLPIARDAGTLDLSVQRASRSLVNSGVTESAWLLGIGIQVRP